MLLLIGMFSVRIQEKKCVLKTYFECDARKIPEQISCSIFLSDSSLGSEMRESLGSGRYVGATFLTTVGRVEKADGDSDHTLAFL